MSTSHPQPNQQDYLEQIERLANTVAELAAIEGWLRFDLVEEKGQTAVQRSISELARYLRFVHHVGDGCLDH